VPFLQFDAEIRRIVCTTNAIESVNATIRRAVRARGHFLSENAALKCIYLALMSLDPTGDTSRRGARSAHDAPCLELGEGEFARSSQPDVIMVELLVMLGLFAVVVVRGAEGAPASW
jgi:hypothetical protein